MEILYNNLMLLPKILCNHQLHLHHLVEIHLHLRQL
jgi:hypothetical protein